MVDERPHDLCLRLDMIRIYRLPIRDTVHGQRDHTDIRVSGAVGDLVIFERLRDMRAIVESCLHGRVEIIGEASVAREMEGAELAGNIGAPIGADAGALDRAEKEMARLLGDVVGKHIARHRAAFPERKGIVDRDRWAGHPLNVEREMAEIGIAGAIGDFVADRLAQRHPVPEIQLGRLVQRVGIGTVGFDVKRPVLAGDFGDLPALLGDNPLAIEEVKSHMAAGASHVINEQIARNHVVFGGTEVIVVRCGYRHCHGYLLKDPFRWSAGRKAADAARVKLFSIESSNLDFHSFVVLCVSA
ncbi:UNVERIFIED_ORG: hypothetical protein GGD58_002848 [Rhizobium pisi]